LEDFVRIHDTFKSVSNSLQLLKPFFSGYYLKRFKDFWNIGNLFLAWQNSQSFRNDLGNSSDIKMCGNLFWVSQNTDFLECSFHSTAWTTPCFVRTTVEKIFAKSRWLRVFSIRKWDCRKVHPYYSKNERWCCEGHITLKNFRILGNRPKRVSERSETDSETLWRFSKGKKWISEQQWQNSSQAEFKNSAIWRLFFSLIYSNPISRILQFKQNYASSYILTTVSNQNSAQNSLSY